MVRQTPVIVFKKLDLFGKRFNLNLEGQEQIGSRLGNIFTILIIAITLFYMQLRTQIMFKMGDTSLQDSE